VNRNANAAPADLQGLVTSVLGSVLLLAVVLGIVSHGARPPAPSEAPAWLLARALPMLGHMAPVVVPLAVLLLLGYVGLEVLRWTVLIPRMRRSRVAYAVLPPPDFAPKPEAIAAFTAHLLGMRRRIFAWLDREATAFCVGLTTTADGRPLMYWELPKRFEKELEGARSFYPGLQLVPLATLEAPAPLPGAKSATRRLELRPGRPERFPLQTIPDEIDALQAFAGVLSTVDVAAGQRLSQRAYLLPVPPPLLARVRRRLVGEAREQEIRDPLASVQGWGDRFNPAEAVERRIERAGLWAKVGKAEPMFRVQVLVRAEARDRAAAGGLVKAVYGAWESWSGQNYMRSVGLPVLGGLVTLFGSNAPWRRQWFDFRFGQGICGNGRVVTGWEVWPLLKPWTRFCRSQSVVRRDRLAGLEPPASAIGAPGVVACLTDEGQPVAIRAEELRRHVHLIGPTGSGKSVWIGNGAIDAIALGTSVSVFDPKDGLTVYDLLERIPREVWDRVVLVDPSRTDRPVGLNALECPDPEMRDVVADQIVGIFERLYKQWWGHRQALVMRAAVLTLLQRPGSTLCDVVPLLLRPEVRRHFVQGLDDPALLDFWRGYEAKGESQQLSEVGPLLSKLEGVLLRRSVRNILGQSRSTIDLADVLDHGGVLLVALPKGVLGEDTSRLLGSFLFARLWQVVQARASRPEDARPDALAFVDEFHNLVHLPSFGEGLAEARSYHWGLVLGHQHMGQLPPDMREAVDANTRTKVAFRPEQDASMLASSLPPLSEGDLRGLREHQAAVRLLSGQAFAGMTRPPAPSLGREHAEELASVALERCGRPRDEVEAEIAERMRSVGAQEAFDEWA
jgi:hypothetical protein